MNGFFHRSCPEVKKLYLLARPKKNKDIEKRIQEQFEDVVSIFTNTFLII
jgi:hypothetical protein